MSAATPPHRRDGLALRAPGLIGPELALVVLADWLFWQRTVGLSLPLFCATVAVLAASLRPGRRDPTRTVAATLMLAAALAPAVERPTALSGAVAVAGTLLCLRLCTPSGPPGWPARFRAAAHDAVAGPGQMVRDIVRRRRLLDRRRGTRAERRLGWLAWIAPLALTGVFAALLADANPLIAGWFAGLPMPSLADVLRSLPRSLFWFVVLAKLWPLVRVRRRGRRTPVSPPNTETADVRRLARLAAALLSPLAVLRALVLLDLLLALQIGLDGAYLWGGLALPEGVTYAAYAHRGAYPLVLTALLAGVVALAIRRRGAPPLDGLATALLLLLLGENVLLVGSAMERLGLYVAAYSLTKWRVAAFAWMGLVALGLALVAVGGALGRDARWLLRTNLLAALAVLYAWCLVDVPRIVADYDVAHCSEARGDGPALDLGMVEALGPEALPALDRHLRCVPSDGRSLRADGVRQRLARAVRDDQADWRGWSLAGWRLARYLDTSGVAEPATPPAGDEGW